MPSAPPRRGARRLRAGDSPSVATRGDRPPPSSSADRLELGARLAAIVDELRLLDADDRDVPLTLAEGLLEDVERELGASADRREP